MWNLVKIKKDRDFAKSEYDRLSLENTQIKLSNLDLEKSALTTIALYDITKEICRSLDEDKVFASFREQINKYIRVGDCKLLREEPKGAQYKDYLVFPLSIDKMTTRYLLASQISGEDKDKFHILTQQFILGIKRAHFYQKVQELAITDSLTASYSRRYLLDRFKEEIKRCEKLKYNFAFLMVDIDHFKDYNDRYGHLVGDAILKEVARTIKENIRQIDLVGRYGGEEFSVILTETDKAGARFAAERIRQAIAQKEIKVYDETLKVTISIGISIFAQNGQDAQSIIDTADQALYQAKQTGRNKVCIYSLPR